MTKNDMRDAVRGALRKLDKTAKYHDGIIDAFIEQSMNQFLYDLYNKSPMDLDIYIREYGTEVALPIAENVSTEEYYTQLPAAYVALPEKNSGIRYVIGHDRDHTMLYPMSLRERILATTSYVGANTSEDGDPFTRSFFTVSGSRIIYFQTNSSLRSAGVRIGILIPFSEYGDTDEVHVPFGQEDKVFISVLQKFQQPQVDLRDNNKDG